MAEQQPNAPETAHQLPETSEIRDKKLQLEFAKQELKRAEDELAAAQHVYDQETAFGKHDVTVPNEGEYTYADYLEQRPAEAVVENDGVFRGEGSGQFAKEADYLDQTLTGQEYYDHKGGLVNEGEYEAPNYEEMGVMQLAKEAANARQLGDRAGEEEIRSALENHLTMDALRDDTETPEQALARYNAEVARYEQLVNRFVSRAEGEASHATDAHQKPSGEGEPSARAVEDNEQAAEAGAYYKGKKVSIVSATKSPIDSSLDGLEVIDEDGVVHRAIASEVSYGPGSTSIEDAPVDTQDANDVDAEGANRTVGNDTTEKENVDASGKELIPLTVPSEVADEEEQSRVDKLKGWLRNSKERAVLLMYSGVDHWNRGWNKVRQGWRDNVLDHGVEETMTDEEKEKKRNRNRILVVAGAAAIVGVGIAAALALGHHGGNGGQGAIGGDLPDSDPSPTPTAPEAPTPEPEVTPPADTEGLRWTPEDLDGIAELSDPIPQGGGGEQLFRDLGMDISKWYNNEDALLQNFPNDFYRMDDGHVGIARPGTLPQEVQDFIRTLQ